MRFATFVSLPCLLLATSSCGGGHPSSGEKIGATFAAKPYSVRCVTRAFAAAGIQLYNAQPGAGKRLGFVALHPDQEGLVNEVTLTEDPAHATALLVRARAVIRAFPKRFKESALAAEGNLFISYRNRPQATRVVDGALQRVRTRCQVPQ